MARHNAVGKWGEDLARDYLTSRGYAIFKTDQRMGRTDIDIVAMRGTSICFVEVKTRTAGDVDPLEAITPAKIRRMTRAADEFLRSYNISHRPQFDVIAITGTPDSYNLEHIEDAFIPPLISYGR